MELAALDRVDVSQLHVDWNPTSCSVTREADPDERPIAVDLDLKRLHLQVGIGLDPSPYLPPYRVNALMNAGPGPLDFGFVTSGSRTKTFTIRNTNPVTLTNISVSLTGQSHPGEFVLSQPGTATLAPGGQTTFQVTFAPSATLGARTATLNIASSDANNNPFLIAITGTRATPSQAWRAAYFGSPDNSGSGADLNDFDGDGLNNLVEYATVSNPRRPSGPPGQLVMNGAVLEFTYTRPVAALTELNYQPEAADSPAGPWSTAGITSTVVSDDGTVQLVKATVSAGTGKRFLRLRVTRL